MTFLFPSPLREHGALVLIGSIPDLDKAINRIKRKHQIVGRDRELRLMLLAALSKRHILLEGPVGVGKTLLARAISDYLSREFIRVDGDERFNENKLIGYWDPPKVLKTGYIEEAFIEGPLMLAAKRGAVLFINELNRMPDSAQNALLPIMDEGIITVPRLGTIKARDGFMIIATQNPEESVGVTRLSEALKDRFVLIKLDYQSLEEELEIVKLRSGAPTKLTRISVMICRETRVDPAVRRGASVRSAIDMATIAKSMSSSGDVDWYSLAQMVLPKRIEIREGAPLSEDEVIRRIVDRVLKGSESEDFPRLRGKQKVPQ